MYKITRLICLLLTSLHCSAQSPRIKSYNTIGWYNIVGSAKLTQRFDLYTEYQWRRNELISTWQQSVLKVGLNYNLNPNIQFRLGYGWIETFPYGKYPINVMGKDFTEHRIFEMVQLKHKEGILDLSHRFMLEQRFIGKYSAPDLEKEDQFPLVNRMRYQFRLQIPFSNPLKSDAYFYGATYDEVMLSFGKNVGVNTFDQNRIGIIAGYQFNSKLKLEAGYINQVVQLSRTEDQKNLFQHNNGLIINFLFKL